MLPMKEQLQALGRQLSGQLYTDDTLRTLYATDASAYRELPLAVAMPKTEVPAVRGIIEVLRVPTKPQ